METDQARLYGIVKAYHEQTKHHPGRYARALGYMDWENQPLPFRCFEGTAQIPLPLSNADRGQSYSALYEPRGGSPDPITLESIALMLELGMGLSAWKQHGASEWALRMNPSSGNLHPTECYLVLPDLALQPACVTHYNPYPHLLEIRASLDRDQAKWLNGHGGFGVILTSVVWREAWKYGERAYRYCQHDLGHALAALRFACNLNGWQMRMIPQVSETMLDRFLGLDRDKMVEGEPEHADCLCWIDGHQHDSKEIVQWFGDHKEIDYKNSPNRLSQEHVDWELISMVQQAGCFNSPGFSHSLPVLSPAANHLESCFSAETIIRRRRSAQNYERKASRTNLPDFLQALRQTLPLNACPFDLFPYAAQVHLALFVHAVEGLEPGLYMFVRNPGHLQSLKDLTHAKFDWQQVTDALPLYRLEAGDFRASAQSISCVQAIAGDSAYSLGMLARFDPVLMEAPYMYPRLFWETGLVGQVLYLEAEARNLRATGIGCFFDDEMHKILGLKNSEWQSLYHFTVGKHLDDSRLETRAPYFHLDR